MTARPFTGRKMTVIMVAFFGVVVAVNLLMATFATRTFGGVVVQNSYVASQKYNLWLSKAREQERLGWTIKPGLDGERRVTLDLSVTGATVTAVAKHPLGREADLPLRFVSVPGGMRSEQPLPQGRWAVHLLVRKGSDEARVIETLS